MARTASERSSIRALYSHSKMLRRDIAKAMLIPRSTIRDVLIEKLRQSLPDAPIPCLHRPYNVFTTLHYVLRPLDIRLGLYYSLLRMRLVSSAQEA